MESILNEWIKKYESKKVDLDQAIRNYIKPGNRIFIDSGCSEPIDLVKSLITLGLEFPDIEIMHFVNLSGLDYFKTVGERKDFFRHNAFFIGNNLRNAVKMGKADYTPMLLSDIPRFIGRGQMHVDTALIQVTPPDKYGYCSFGVNVDIAKPITEAADFVVAEINPKMPHTLGDSFIHMDDIDAFVVADHDIIEFTYARPNKAVKRISKYVASLIEDESTIQTGIGVIPNSLTKYLEVKKNLGVHSEVFSDGIVDLVEQGVITCEKKSIHKGKIICSFVMGSRRLYDFVDDNPMIEFRPTNYTNDPFIISQNEKQVAINAALTVDITGQVNADSLGPEFYSGIGGQVDFMRGANRSHGGKPITVLPSTATLKDGTVVSRVVPYLQQGSGIVITRGDVHFVVTEWGIAYLFGKSIRERVIQMISIAHPDFREELLEYAKNLNYVYPDQELPKSVEGRVSIYPDKYETYYELSDGTTIKIRPVKPTDERMLQELYYSMGKQDRYLRFFTTVRSFGHKRIQPLVNIDYFTKMILVGEIINKGERKIISTAAFYKSKEPSKAEIGGVVHENWRKKGIMRFMLEYLAKIGRELNVRFFSGDILLQNKPMLHIINTIGYPITYKNVEYGEFEFTYDISKKQEARTLIEENR